MKRALFVSRIRADASGSGGQQRRHAALSALRKVAQVDQLILGYDRATSAPDELYLPSLNKPRFSGRRARGLVDRNLVYVAQGWSENMARLSRTDRALLRSRIGAADYDIIYSNRAVCASSVLAALGAKARSYATYVDLDDLVSDVILANLRTEGFSRGIQTGIARAVEAMMVRSAERRVTTACDAAFICSTEDRTRLRARCPAANVVVLPNISAARAWPAADLTGTLRLLFVGSLDYQPNFDGVSWFVGRIWPAVLDHLRGQVTMTIVGRGSPALGQAFSGVEGLDVHLNVPDLAPFYRHAHACVVPIRYGGGTSIKTIEAMASNRPILSTAVGVRGLGMQDGAHYLQFEDAGTFVAACRRLIEDPARKAVLAAAAGRLWQANFSQQAVDDIIASVVATAP